MHKDGQFGDFFDFNNKKSIIDIRIKICKGRE